MVVVIRLRLKVYGNSCDQMVNQNSMFDQIAYSFTSLKNSKLTGSLRKDLRTQFEPGRRRPWWPAIVW